MSFTVNGGDVSKCILVKEQGGTYTIPPDAEREDWTDVAWEADGLQHIERLEGWGEWVDTWRTYLGAETLTYFVGEAEFSPEARQALAQVMTGW